MSVNLSVSMGTPHPMIKEDGIMWTELYYKRNFYKRKILNHGDEPK